MKNKPEKVFIIAEAGVNHNGDVGTAMHMIDVAKKAGADAVKFQTFKAEQVISRFAGKAAYQKRTSNPNESQLEMIRRYELSEADHKSLIKHCRKRGIVFLSAPFDIGSIDLLRRLGLKVFKIPSGEITNLPYLKKIGSMGKRIILSTGMSDMPEVKNAVRVLERSGTSKKKITVLHCNTEYPTPYRDVNLLAMLTLRDKLKVRVGYSDHTPGIEVAIAAVALGACVIEKHFTLDRNMPGPDHKASLEPVELKAMVEAVRNIEQAMGSGEKKPSSSELKNLCVVRKSIVARKSIAKGDSFTSENIAVKRPGIGLSPMMWNDVIGSQAKKNFKEDDLIRI